MTTHETIFSLKGRGLKLNTREDIVPLLTGIDPAKLEEIHFGGNTIGVDASLALAEFLQKAVNLKVSDILSSTI
jgi:Ran GTPase-activating protein 1